MRALTDALTVDPRPTESLLARRAEGAWAFFLVSLALHGGLTTLGLALSWVLAGPSVQLQQKPITASLVRLGKPRDEKLLPRLEEAPPPPPARPVEVPTAPEVAAPVPSAAVPVPTREAKAPPAARTKEQPRSLFDALKRTGVAGKPDDTEGAADGEVDGTAARAESERYYALLKAAIERNYDVADTIPEAERIRLKAQVAIWLGRGGEVEQVKLVRPSGNEVFDAAVLQAIRRASPFGPPPSHLRGVLEKDGVALAFSP